MIYYFATTRTSRLRKPGNMYHQECKEMLTLISCWRKCTMAQLLWEKNLAAPQVIKHRVTT